MDLIWLAASGSYVPSAGAAAFSPDDIAGLDFWIAADEIEGLADNAPVATWEDLSDQNNDAAQADANKRPLYDENIQNGLPAVLFAASDEMLTIDSLPAIGTTHTAFAVIKPTASGGNAVIGQHETGNTSAMQYVFAFDGTNLAYHDTANLVQVAHGGLVHGTTYLLEVVRNGTSVKFYKNAAQIGTEQTLGSNTATSLNSVGGRLDGLLLFAGHIMEALVYDTALSDANREAVEGYLDTKWGL